MNNGIGVRQPFVIDEIDNFAVRRQVFIAITLQDFMCGKPLFERDERYIGFVSISDEENKRFFADHFLVVIHPSDAVV